MKTILKLSLLIPLFAFFTGCDAEEDWYEYDNNPPSPPSNVYTITGDERVDIIWDANPERDVAGYNVYYSFSYDGRYELIGSTREPYFIDWDVSNGVTYYYGIAAYDYNGNESELSYDVVYDTPRPEGFNQIVFDYTRFPNLSGYDFSTFSVLPFDYQDEQRSADFFLENYEGQLFINVWDDTDIQDMGRTDDIYDISYAPEGGWASEKYVPVVLGNTYVIWTWDNHFAKIRIKNYTNDRITFDWAYQIDEGNRELKENLTKVRNKIDVNSNLDGLRK